MTSAYFTKIGFLGLGRFLDPPSRWAWDASAIRAADNQPAGSHRLVRELLLPWRRRLA